MTKPVTKPVTKSVTKLNHILKFWTKIPKICGFGIGYGISQNHWPIRISVSVSDRNQNSGFGRSLGTIAFHYEVLHPLYSGCSWKYFWPFLFCDGFTSKHELIFLKMIFIKDIWLGEQIECSRFLMTSILNYFIL